MVIKLSQNSWYGGAPVSISLPDDWDARLYGMPADSAPRLTRAQIKEIMDSPLGTRPIFELAKGKKEAAVVFDDMSRGTPCRDMAEIAVSELLAAGMEPGHIRFICALGSHGACTRADFEKKLGPDIVRDFAVFNHSAFQNTTLCGVTSAGIALRINSELMACDLKLALGSISPHPVNGFGGGAKAVLIGCADLRTIAALHKASDAVKKERGMDFAESVGCFENNGMRSQIEEGAAMVGLDYKADAILDSDCRIVGLSAGEPVAEWRAGAELSRKLNFCSETPRDMDVVIANANVKANEAAIALAIAHSMIKEGGTILLVDFNAGGQVLHQFSGASGYFTGGPSYHGIFERYPKAGQVIIYTPYPSVTDAISFGDPSRISFVTSWEQAAAMLAAHGAGTRAAVLSDATVMGYSK